MAVLAQISFIPEIMYANLSARSQRQGLLGSIAMAEPEDHGPAPPIPGARHAFGSNSSGLFALNQQIVGGPSRAAGL